MLRPSDSLISINSANNHKTSAYCYFPVLPVGKLRRERPSWTSREVAQLTRIQAQKCQPRTLSSSPLPLPRNQEYRVESVTRPRTSGCLTTAGQSRGCDTQCKFGAGPRRTQLHTTRNSSFTSVTVLTTLSTCSPFSPVLI